MSDNSESEIKRTVHRMFDEVINHEKIDLIEDLFDPEFETVTPQGVLGLVGFKAYVVAWRAGFPDINCQVEGLIAEGDKAAWSIRARGTHTGEFMGISATGRTVDFDSLNLATFRNGRNYRHTVMMDLTKMMPSSGSGRGRHLCDGEPGPSRPGSPGAEVFLRRSRIHRLGLPPQINRGDAHSRAGVPAAAGGATGRGRPAIEDASRRRSGRAG